MKVIFFPHSFTSTDSQTIEFSIFCPIDTGSWMFAFIWNGVWICESTQDSLLFDVHVLSQKDTSKRD